MVEPLLVPDDLDRHGLAGAMVAAVQHLTERALAQSVDDFVAVRQMVMHDNEIVASFVVVAVIIRGVV